MVQTVPGAGRRAAWLRLGRGLSQAERGQATLEYVGSLIAASVVVILVAAALALPASRQKLATAVRVAVCASTVGEVCGSPSDGGPSAVATDPSSTGGDSTGGQPAGSGKKDDWNCHGFWGCTWNGVKQFGSGGFNVGKGAVDDVVGIWDLAKDPGQVVDAGKYIWNHPWDSAKQLVWDNDSGDMWGRQDYGGAIGRTVWNVGSWFIPGVDVAKGVSKFGKLGKLGKVAEVAGDLSKLDRLADDAGALAKTAEKAAERGDAKAARDAATAARKKADEAESEARSRGCPIAAGLIPGPRPVVRPGLVLAAGGGRLGAAGGMMTIIPRTGEKECGEATEAAKKADQEADGAEDAAKAAEGPAWLEPGSLAAEEQAAVDATLKEIDSGVKPANIRSKDWNNKYRNVGHDLPGGQLADSPYREYPVPPEPGVPPPGGRRIVVNRDTGAAYYTWTHYGDDGAPAFVRIR